MAMKLFGYEAIRLVARGPWSVNLVDFHQHLLFSFRPHITVSILAFQRSFFEILEIGTFWEFISETAYDVGALKVW